MESGTYGVKTRLRTEAFKDVVVKLARLDPRGFAEEKHFKMEALKRS